MSASRVAADTLRLLPRKRMSHAMGLLAAATPSPGLLARAIAFYVRAYDVDLAEADVPSGGWRSFDEFFTRRLKEGARPLEGDAGTLVSPADGRIEDAGPVGRDARFVVKGQHYDVASLLGDGVDGARFEGGAFCVVYLSPRDYHRVHAPVTGRVHTVRHVGGTLLPVNAFGARSYPGLLARNERVAVLQSRQGGEVASILVGAVGVGRISVSFDASVMTNVGRAPTTIRYGAEGAPEIVRGEELGIFHLGSTVVVLVALELRPKLVVAAGDRVRMGQALAMLEAR